MLAMNERKAAEAFAAAIEQATAAGDRNRAQELADLLGRVMAPVGSDMAGGVGSPDPAGIPLPWPKQLAGIARSISTEALSAELAAERGDWGTVHATYERLALLFAEYRLLYVQCRAPTRTAQ